MRIVEIHEYNVPPIVFKARFTHDNGQEFVEKYQTSHGIIQRKLRVHIEPVSVTKYLSQCCPPQWLSNKINKGHILENINRDNELSRLDSPQLSYIINSGTITLKSKTRFKLPSYSYWQTTK